MAFAGLFEEQVVPLGINMLTHAGVGVVVTAVMEASAFLSPLEPL
jgi:hypothetical protein